MGHKVRNKSSRLYAFPFSAFGNLVCAYGPSGIVWPWKQPGRIAVRRTGQGSNGLQSKHACHRARPHIWCPSHAYELTNFSFVAPLQLACVRCAESLPSEFSWPVSKQGTAICLPAIIRYGEINLRRHARRRSGVVVNCQNSHARATPPVDRAAKAHCKL
jgi:hypothetical protein